MNIPVTFEFGYAGMVGHTEKQPIKAVTFTHSRGVTVEHYFDMPDGVRVYLSIRLNDPIPHVCTEECEENPGSCEIYKRAAGHPGYTS